MFFSVQDIQEYFILNIVNEFLYIKVSLCIYKGNIFIVQEHLILVKGLVFKK